MNLRPQNDMQSGNGGVMDMPPLNGQQLQVPVNTGLAPYLITAADVE